MSAPFAREPVTLHLTGDAVVSEPYIDMTARMMSIFGLPVEHEPGSMVYKVPKAVYRNPREYLVEGDASSATYPLAVAASAGGAVTVEGVGSDSLQGDAAFCRVRLPAPRPAPGPHAWRASCWSAWAAGCRRRRRRRRSRARRMASSIRSAST
jgi:hypothetical protein